MIETPPDAHVFDQLHQRRAFVLGQPARDLVEQQHARLRRQCARELKPLAVEQGQPAGAFVGLFGQSAMRKQFGATFIDGSFAFATAEGRRHNHVLEYGHAGEWLRDLERAREAFAAPALRREARNVLAVEQHASRVRGQRAGGDAEQAGLAGAVRSDDAECLALVQREVDAVGNDHRAEPLRDILQREDRGHGLSFVMRGRDPRIPLRRAQCLPKRDGRDKFTAGPAGGRSRLPGHDDQIQIYEIGCSLPPTGIFGAVLFSAITRSNLPFLRCHCPATSAVLVTFFTGAPVHWIGPTIDW